MKKGSLKILILIGFIKCLTACDAVKHLSDKEFLLTKNTLIVDENKTTNQTLNNLLYQQPNSKIPLISTPLRLHLYNLARPNIDSLLNAKIYENPKKVKRKTRLLSKKQLDKDIKSRIDFNTWLKKTGEAPVIVDSLKTKKSINRLRAYYINNGWFDVNTSFAIKKQNHNRAEVVYNIEKGMPYTINSVTQHIQSPVIDTLFKQIKKEALIKPNEQFKTANFNQERERITSELRNEGVYHFKSDYINFQIDSIGTNKTFDVDINIPNRLLRTRDSISYEPFKIFTINDVKIITDYTFENTGKPFKDSISYNGYKIYSYDKMRFRPKAISDAIFINPGDAFKDINRTRTYTYLNQLRTFKYPNIDYVENPDNTLSSTILLSPLKKFSLGFSTDISQSNIQSIGFSLNPSLLIRNIFRGAETFEISAITSIGASEDANRNNLNDPFFDINEYGIDLKLTIPRLFSPFYTEGIIPKYMSPNTRINLATTSQTNIGLDKQTLSAIFSYNWSPNQKVNNRLDVLNIQYVRNLNVANYFGIYQNSLATLNQVAGDLNYINPGQSLSFPEQADEFINYMTGPNTPTGANPAQVLTVNSIKERKERLTENNLILSTNFSFTKDDRTNLFDNNFSIFRAKLELAGNLLSTTSKLLKAPKNGDDRHELFNVAYSQFIKTELDYIKHWDFGANNILAIRSLLGIAIPYGNSSSIPFSKSFFAGGPNDNRAWTAYSLGPGSFETTNEFNEANLKIALGIEQRFNLFGNLNGAIFIDAGNIWNVLDNVEDERATFKSLKDLNNIAIGSGIGFRYDLSFFVFRFDIGFKTYDPSYQDQNRWLNDYNFANAVYNIGINYPF